MQSARALGFGSIWFLEACCIEDGMSREFVSVLTIGSLI